jgi:hypothetical protein
LRDRFDAGKLFTAASAAAAFSLLARRVSGRGGTALDRTARRRLQRRRSAPLDVTVRVLTTPGYPWAYIPASVRGAHGGRAVVASALLGWASHHAVKLRVRRRRPPSQREQSNYLEAFPSGHTTPVTAIALTTAYVLAREGLAPAVRVAPAALAAAAVVGGTRVYLDEHWATDVAGAWALGIVVATLCGAFYDARERPARRVNRLRVRG